MTRLLLRRAGWAVLTLFFVLAGCFAAVRLTGSPVDLLYGDGATLEQIAELEREWGLDRPLPEQFFRYLHNVMRGDFGVSLVERRPVVTVYAERLAASLQLAALAFVLGTLVGVPLGILSAVGRGGLGARLAMGLTFFGFAVPHFIIALALILVFGYHLNWLPSTGASTPAHFVLPAITLALPLMAVNARYMRNALLDVLRQDYVRTARAKGVHEFRVVGMHAMRNAVLPLITVLGLEVAGLLNGSLIVETVFSWPGVGKILTGSVSRRDFPVLQFEVIVYACVVVSVNLLVDLLYVVVDPRVRVNT